MSAPPPQPGPLDDKEVAAAQVLGHTPVEVAGAGQGEASPADGDSDDDPPLTESDDQEDTFGATWEPEAPANSAFAFGATAAQTTQPAGVLDVRDAQETCSARMRRISNADASRARTLAQNGHMTPCACHCAACRAAGHGNTCVVLRMGLIRLFDAYAAKLPVAELPVASGDDVVDLVLRHYHGGAIGWDTARFEAEIRSMQYGPAGDVLAAGDVHGCIHLICAQTGATFLCLKGHSWAVNAVSWSIAGLLASASDDCTVKIWNPSAGECLNTLEGHSSEIRGVRFSLDGTMLASCSGGFEWRRPQTDYSVRLWDVRTGRELKKLEGHTFLVTACDWAPDGKTVVSASADNTLKIWDVASGTCQATLKGHSSWVTTAAWSFDGKLLASSGWDKSIILWDAKKGERLMELNGHIDWVKTVSWSGAGLLASTSDDRTVKIWNPSAGECLKTLEGHSKHNKNCTCEFATDGSFKKANPCPVQGHSGRVRTAAWSCDDGVVASGGDDRKIILWDSKKGKRLMELNGHRGDLAAAERQELAARER